jgi:flagellar assembly protein FliH
MTTPTKRITPPSQPRSYHFPQLSDVDGVAKDYAESQQQFDTGYASGHQQGYEEGLAQGKRDGQTQGHQDGLAQGMAEGRKLGQVEGQKQYQQAIKPIQALTEQLQQTLNFQISEQKALILQLLQQITTRVFAHELAQKPEHLMRLITESCATLPEPNTRLKIHLNPQDRQRLEQVGFTLDADWTLQDDPKLAVGACRIETSQSVIEASLSQQADECLQHIATQLDTAAESA